MLSKAKSAVAKSGGGKNHLADNRNQLLILILLDQFRIGISFD